MGLGSKESSRQDLSNGVGYNGFWTNSRPETATRQASSIHYKVKGFTANVQTCPFAKGTSHIPPRRLASEMLIVSKKKSNGVRKCVRNMPGGIFGFGIRLHFSGKLCQNLICNTVQQLTRLGSSYLATKSKNKRRKCARIAKICEIT